MSATRSSGPVAGENGGSDGHCVGGVVDSDHGGGGEVVQQNAGRRRRRRPAGMRQTRHDARGGGAVLLECTLAQQAQKKTFNAHPKLQKAKRNIGRELQRRDREPDKLLEGL